jgi:DsbC/DsbD-like thiol-disulfide interchange protein
VKGNRLSNIKIAAVVLLLVTIATCSRSAVDNRDQTASNTAAEPQRIASVDVVKATPQQVDIPAGGSADTTLNLKIQNGYHVNANPPTYPYLKATELDLPSSLGISVGFISYPTPIKKKFSFAEGPLAVYEGETTLKVRLKADRSAAPGTHNLAGKLRVQACDDQVCYPPGTIDVAIPVTIK